MPYYDPTKPISPTNRPPGQPRGLAGMMQLPGSIQEAGQQFGTGIRQTGQTLGGAIAYPFQQTGQAYSSLFSGIAQGIRGQPQAPMTDSAVNAGSDAGVPQQRTLANPNYARTDQAIGQGMGRMGQLDTPQRALSRAQQQSPIGVARQAGMVGGQPRTRYFSEQGTAEFQGLPRGGGGFGGAATNADVQRRQADYAAKGLNVYGNDMRAIGQLQGIGDAMQRARLSNTVGNPEYRSGERARALAGLAGLQQGEQIQAEAQNQRLSLAQQQQQQGFENNMAARRQVVDEMLAGAQLSEAKRKAIAEDPFSEKSMATAAQEFMKNAPLGDEWKPQLAAYFALLGGLYNPETNEILNPAEVAALPPEARDRLRAYALGQQ